MDISSFTRKQVGALGEKVAAEYLRRRGFSIRDRNFVRKTGELDIIAEKESTLHFVEVKTILANNLPSSAEATEGRPPDYDSYDPSLNLHSAKVRKVARTGEWYVLEKKWEGEWQDGCLVWLRRRDGIARVSYLPQIV